METIRSPREKGTTMEWIAAFVVVLVFGATIDAVMAQAEMDYYDNE